MVKLENVPLDVENIHVILLTDKAQVYPAVVFRQYAGQLQGKTFSEVNISECG